MPSTREDPSLNYLISNLESETYDAYSLARALVGCCGNNDCRANMKRYEMASGEAKGKKGGVSIDQRTTK